MQSRFVLIVSPLLRLRYDECIVPSKKTSPGKPKLAPASPLRKQPTTPSASAKTGPRSRSLSRAQTIAVATASATYQVHIGEGLLATLSARLSKLLNGKLPRLFVVTSPEIWALWGGSFLASFKVSSPTVLFLPSGESKKRLASVESLADQLASAGADRDSLLIAFGGGVVGDLTGFLAAIYMRGIRYVGVPTTFLAQVDSSLGGKTGVNLARGKNMIGSFHHPLAVYADTALLQTLPLRELRAGLHESIKAGVIYDARLFAYLEVNTSAVLRAEAAALQHVVAASVRMKAAVVGNDERENGLRMILNFGHTVGHAIEAATGYKLLLHGEAVAWGMLAALRIAHNRSLVSEQQFERIASLILDYGPLPTINVAPAKLAALTAGDKKNRSGVRSFVLPTTIGKAVVVTDVTEAELTGAIEEMLLLARPKSPSRSR